MPITKYTCNNCGNEFAKIYFSLEDAAKSCPVCDAEDLREGGPAFQADIQQMQRALGASCDSCAENNSCAPAAGST